MGMTNVRPRKKSKRKLEIITARELKNELDSHFATISSLNEKYWRGERLSAGDKREYYISKANIFHYLSTPADTLATAGIYQKRCLAAFNEADFWNENR